VRWPAIFESIATETLLRVVCGPRYTPGIVVGVRRHRLIGVQRRVYTSYVERQNLTIRMQQRRFTRLTNGFSKKLENHVAAVSLYVAHYNLCRVHESLRITPALAIGMTDHIWTIGELIRRRYGRRATHGRSFPKEQEEEIGK
jgi:hypothetical protein